MRFRQTEVRMEAIWGFLIYIEKINLVIEMNVMPTLSTVN